MTDEQETIDCKEHGESIITYVCSHLIADPVQRWHCAWPSEDKPCPDAWCDQCNVAYLREGEWNDHNSDGVDIKILCRGCYEKARSKSVTRLTGERLAAWQSFVEMCHEELHSKQDRLGSEYSLGSHERWDWDQARAEIVFSNDGIPALIAKIEFVGSFSTKSNTWLWSWANPSVLESARSRIGAIYDVGEEQDFPHLTVPKWPAEEADGWEMAAVAAHVLNASGVYRTPDDTGFTFMLLTEIRHAN